MKHLLLSLSLLTAPAGASAQIFSGDAGRGTVLGGLIGGIIGHNSNRRTMEGIGIGAGTGWLLGSINRQHHNRGAYDTYIPSRRRSVYADSAPVHRRPNYAVAGAALGGITGAIAGHNQNRQTLEGMAIGAATGLAVGGIAEHATRKRESRHYYAREAQPVLLSNSRFYRNPTPPPPESTIVRKQPNSRLKQPTRGFERISSSRTSNRHPVPLARPAQPAQTIIINNYYYSSTPPATTKTTNRPATKPPLPRRQQFSTTP